MNNKKQSPLDDKKISKILQALGLTVISLPLEQQLFAKNVSSRLETA